MGCGFGAFGDDLHAEVAGEAEDGLDDGEAVVVLGHTGDEGAIDLEQIEGETMQVAERGEAGAEVVDAEADAKRFELGEDADGVFGVGHADALGDLETEGVGIDAGVVEDLLDLLDEVGSSELPCGEIDADRERLRARELLVPAVHGAAGLAEDPGVEEEDEAGVLGDADELVGIDELGGGLAPADEGLEADDFVAAERHDGLVVELELVVFESAAEAGFECRGG